MKVRSMFHGTVTLKIESSFQNIWPLKKPFEDFANLDRGTALQTSRNAATIGKIFNGSINLSNFQI